MAASLNSEGATEEAAAAFEGIDEEQLDDGAWGGEPEIDLGTGEDQADELGDGVDGEPAEGDEEEGGWEMEVRIVPSRASARPATVDLKTSHSVSSWSSPKMPVKVTHFHTKFLCEV